MPKFLCVALIAMLGLTGSLFGQADDPRRDTADLIREVDDLLKSLGDDFPDTSGATTIPVTPPANVSPPAREGVEPFRIDDTLMPPALHERPRKPALPEPREEVSTGRALGAVASNPLDSLTTEELKKVFKQMSYEQLLRHVDTIEDSPFGSGGGSNIPGVGPIQLIDPSGASPSQPGKVSTLPIPGSTGSGSASTTTAAQSGSTPTQRQFPSLHAPLMVTSTKDQPDAKPRKKAEQYVVFDEDRINDELSERIREAIMETRMSHSGTNYPAPSSSIKTAESYCNKVLHRLSKPEHKQYRRDILLALINMFDNSEMLVEEAKSIERFLEEFANDPKYPFENGEESPTIAEMHLRLGKTYRRMGAFRLAVNKFYDAINATLTLPKNKAFQYKHLADEAMLEIAETYLETEDYADAIKYFSRLLNVTNLNKTEEGNVRFKHAYAHYQRAAQNLRHEARLKLEKDPKKLRPEDLRMEYAPGTSPKYDLDRVELSLRDFSFSYPDSYFVPESHYLLALTYQEQNKDDKAINQVKALLSTSPWHPDKIKKEQDHPERAIDMKKVAEMMALWNFWKKKTGNYLGNKFFDDGDYFKAKQVYEVLVRVDDDPAWEIPLLYQIGLCNERLGNVGAARTIYEDLEATPAEKITSDNIRFVIDMAKQRSNFVGWARSADKLLLKAARN